MDTLRLRHIMVHISGIINQSVSSYVKTTNYNGKTQIIVENSD